MYSPDQSGERNTTLQRSDSGLRALLHSCTSGYSCSHTAAQASRGSRENPVGRTVQLQHESGCVHAAEPSSAGEQSGCGVSHCARSTLVAVCESCRLGRWITIRLVRTHRPGIRCAALQHHVTGETVGLRSRVLCAPSITNNAMGASNGPTATTSIC